MLLTWQLIHLTGSDPAKLKPMSWKLMCSRGTRLRPALTRTCCSLASCKAMKSPTQLTRTSCAINNLTRFIPAPCPASGFCPTLRKLILCTGFNEKYYSTSFLSMYRILCLILSRFKLYGYDQIRSPIIYNLIGWLYTSRRFSVDFVTATSQFGTSKNRFSFSRNLWGELTGFLHFSSLVQ